MWTPKLLLMLGFQIRNEQEVDLDKKFVRFISKIWDSSPPYPDIPLECVLQGCMKCMFSEQKTFL